MDLQQAESLITAENRVDPAEPTALLAVPRVDVLADLREAWRSLKKPANIYLVVDVSGSMEGEKLAEAKEALVSFVDQMGERDQVALVAFSSRITEVHSLGPLDREKLKAQIRGLRASGGTLLYDAVAHAHRKLQEEGDPDRINVVVAMTDGQSQGDFGAMESQMRGADFPVLVFTVAYGDDAELEVLQRIARLGDGRAYPSDPATIRKLYKLLSAFF